MDTVGGVTRVDETFFHTRDGTKLSARLWLPDGVSLDADKLRAPAVIEILPYGYATATVDTDEATYPYLAGNGIACIRVDSRGSGNSEGSLDDEYSPQQQQDACDACEWAAAQPWCTGAVGMMGCSWGGFVALQVASLAGETANLPSASREAPSLRAVCAVCATDERASDDMHWMGGSLLGENLAWGAWLLDSLAAPPMPVASSVGTASPPRVLSGDTSPYDSGDEAAAGADAEADPSDGGQSSWESRWVSRLEELKPMHGDWASLHPESSKGKSYWKQGSVGSGGRSNIAVPVLSVGCLHGGGYANSTPRLARALGPNRVKAVMGSWVHNYPHLSKSGPAFGFLAEVLAFWKEHLFVPGNTTFDRDAEPNANRREVPGVRVHVQRPPLEGGPTTAPDRAEGYWVAEHSQDRLDAAAEEGAFLLSFTPDGALEARADNVNRDELDIFSHPKVMTDTPEKPVGVASGRWFTFGDGDDLPSDQHPDDELSVCFDGSPVTVETAIIGAPRVVVACRRVGEDVETQSGVVVARICAVAPDGSSHLITYGVCNVSAMHDTRSVSSYPATEEDDSTFVVDVVCDYRAFSIPVGWKLRVALSQTYWPVIAPSPAGFEPLAIVGGACEIPALSDEHITDKWSFSVDTIPELEVLVAPLATRGLRGGEVRNHLIGAGTSAKAIRQADSGARLVQIKDSRIIVESQAVDISAKSSRSQRIERRRVIKGLDVSGRTSPKSMLDSHHVCGPASPTSRSSRSSTSGLVDAEVVVGAEMTVVDGAYKFDTKLEAFVTEDNEGSDTENRRSVFARSWTEIAPAA
jgi:predicted acyl esterase